MRRVIKKSNKRGFTLVETLLATFILVVISTMLVNGFIATMGYSYQTSVYSKSGANNYSACMNKVAEWNTLADRGTSGRQKKLSTATGVQQLTFSKTSDGQNSFKKLYVGVESNYQLKDTVPATLPFKNAAYAPKDGTTEHGGAGSDQLADNRKVIYYYPEYWRGPSSNSNSFYKVAIMLDNKNKDANGNPTYKWVVLETYEVSEKTDLSYLLDSTHSANHYIGPLNASTHNDYGAASSNSSNSNAG